MSPEQQIKESFRVIRLAANDVCLNSIVWQEIAAVESAIDAAMIQAKLEYDRKMLKLSSLL